ncbi:MAG: S8 family serine peptidase [Halanaerobiales bacterium]|nr:S8 family serine peptidase [Halanaerobiales bacterium]
MSRKFRRNLGLLLVLSMAFMLFSITSLASNDLRLKGFAKDNKLPYGLIKKAYQSGVEGPYIIICNGPIDPEMKSGMYQEGANLVEYIPEFSFLALMTPEEAKNVEALSFVEDVMIYQPAYKVNPSLKDEFGNIKNDGEVTVRIMTFGDDTTVLDNEIINAHGKKVANGKGKVVVTMHSNQLEKFANLNSVKYIEIHKEYKLFNDVAKGYMDVDDLWNLGYEGSGQVVGVCDTGLDTGVNNSGMHLDFQGRIDAIYALGRSTADDPHGHGTHVAGSVLGDGARSNGQIKGMAPAAHLVFQSVLDSRGGLGGLPNDLNTLFAESWNAGARIHTNSWGASVNDYDVDAQNLDEYVWNNDMIVLFAAGNDGTDDTWTQILYDSIGTPGTAKNCITVGASENYRPSLHSISDNPNEIAIFSSRGWTEDGRIKPDIVAPGTFILSTRSTLAADTSFWANYDTYYAYMGGTSMATPLTAGAVATAREFMQTEWNHTPSPAMMKAAIINGATDMGFGVPSRDQGWGRVSLIDSLVSKEYQYEDENYSLNTGQSQNFNYTIQSGNTPLRVTLVWTDYPGSTTASKALVNDLDVKVTSPSGTVYYGNDFTSPYNTAYDRLNNVENVWISNPELGNYTVEVIAYNVPNGPQPFAVFVSADFGTSSGDITPPTCSLTAPSNGATVIDTITLSATASDNETVNRVEFYVDGAKVATDTTSPYSASWDTTTVSNGSHSIQAKAFDANGNVGSSNTITVTVDNPVSIVNTTDTFSDNVRSGQLDEFTINVTGTGTIDLSMNTSSCTIKLYNPAGTNVATGTSSITYNATVTGNYKITVTTTSRKKIYYTLTATYPVIQ